MKTVGVTISGIDTLLTLPAGSRIEASGSGAIVWMNKEYGNKQFTIEESPSELITQLSDALLVSRDGKDIIYILTPGSMVKQNGANVDISLYIGGNDKFSVVGTIGGIFTTPSTGATGNVIMRQFNTTAGVLVYSAATIGANLTGKTLGIVMRGGQDDSQQGGVAINGSGGLTWTFDPGTESVTYFYT